MIRNIKIHNILNIIENSKSMKPINVLIKKYENIYLNVSYDFAKFDGSKRIKVWMFLMVPPKEIYPLHAYVHEQQCTLALPMLINY